MTNIYIINATSMGLNVINYLKKRILIKGIIGLTKRKTTDNISGYVYLEEFCKENKIDFIPVAAYSLNGANDKERISSLDIDILIVVGWQRLVPEWLINHCKVCVIGAHGSPYGITGGRGRSPQNWALILGKKEFFISIFKIDPGIDSGKIINTKLYHLTEYDDIRTSHFKAGWLVGKMIADSINKGKISSGEATLQTGRAQYLPQRLPEDGGIDWRRSTEEIYNFIRALISPYPGAFCGFLDYKLTIWKATPFKFEDENMEYAPGEIARIFYHGELLVRTGNGFLLIEDYSVEPEIGQSYLRENLVLLSCDFRKQIKRIVERHYKRYPDLEIADEIMNIVD